MNILRNGWVVMGLWIATIAMGWFGIGSQIAERIEGIDPTQIPSGPTVVMWSLVVISIAASIWWALGLRQRDEGASAAGEDAPLHSGRRRFLTGSAVVAGGAVGVTGAAVGRLSGWMNVTGPALGAEVVQTDPNPRAMWDGSRVRSYRPLGNTGLMVSDISLGSTRLHHHAEPVRFLREWLDRGVNYIDASPDYAPESEEIIREALKGRDRSEIVLASKFCTGEGHVRHGSGVQHYIDAIDGALQRMETDYLDVAHIHACDSVERLLDENVHEAFDRLKEQGKVRFLGVSTHTPNLESVANAAIDSGRFSAMMLAYHHGAWPNQTAIIDRAAAAGIGVIGMKTLKGAKHRGLADFRPEADSYAQAAFKWVLSNPSVANLVISVFENQHLDEYLYASGQPLDQSDVAVLEKYDALIAGTHCFQHCGTCLDQCPSSAPIPDVLRYRMYFEDYGDQKQAMQYYARLEQNASACINCDAPCANACPAGVPIRERMVGAHQMLHFDATRIG